MYQQLSNTFIWSHLNQNNVLTTKMASILKDGIRLSPQNLSTSLMTLRSRFKGPLTSTIMEEISSGSIQLYYAVDQKWVAYMPFFLIAAEDGKIVPIVVINNITEAVSDDDEYSVDVKKLKVYLESAYMAKRIQMNNGSAKLRSNTLIKAGSKIYVSMMSECLARKHGIKMDPNVYNGVNFIITKFYIYNMLGVKDMGKEAMFNYCLYNTKNADLISIESIDEYFQEEDFKDISTLIKAMAECPYFKARLGKLTVSNFLESVINMYDNFMLLGLEAFPYLLMNIISVNEGTYLNNYSVLKDKVDRDGRQIVADLIVSIC